MKIEPHSVQARLQKWGRWRQQPRPQLAAWPSIFGRIKDEGGNAGIPSPASTTVTVCNVILQTIKLLIKYLHGSPER